MRTVYRSRVGAWSSVTGVFIKRGNLDADMHTYGKHSVKMQAETDCRCIYKPTNAKDGQQTPRSLRRGVGRILPHSPQKEPNHS